jgi:hypothetical protein
VNVPPPAATDEAHWPASLDELEGQLEDAETKRRLKNRSLRAVLLYEEGLSIHKSRWMKKVSRLGLACPALPNRPFLLMRSNQGMKESPWVPCVRDSLSGSS